MKGTISKEITQCSSLKVSRRFGENIAFIFMIDEEAKQDTTCKLLVSRAKCLAQPILRF